MNQPKKIPDPEKFKRIHERFQENIYQLDILNLKLEQLNAMMELELFQQRLERLERRKKLRMASESEDKLTMSQPKRIPDPEKFKRTHEGFQETIRLLDIWNLKLEQLNAMMDIELGQQRLERIERKKKLLMTSENQERSHE
ncbi:MULTISPECIES: hypothetical protein [Aerosakkonema]|uniref:hypothetical protein n=1 Tax=Aerosakkonema TaxID=1246629 RepID=UPI0035B7A935